MLIFATFPYIHFRRSRRRGRSSKQTARQYHFPRSRPRGILLSEADREAGPRSRPRGIFNFPEADLGTREVHAPYSVIIRREILPPDMSGRTYLGTREVQVIILLAIIISSFLVNNLLGIHFRKTYIRIKQPLKYNFSLIPVFLLFCCLWTVLSFFFVFL